ncbi:MAG: FtsX-like permease family protein [Bacteroidetes bacterium]|nr:MAG: FtsX-like permease family protein [Bacteroidota bacterium]
MLRHCLTISLRNLLRNRSHSLINVAGLTLGLLCATLIFLKIRHETRFDAHRPEVDQIYRVMIRSTGMGIANSGVPFPFGAAFRADFPDLPSCMVEVTGPPSISLEGSDKPPFQEETPAAMVESSYFDIIAHDWIEAPAPGQMAGPNMAVISDKLAEKYFGAASPIGQLIQIDNQYSVQIVGRFRDPGLPTELPFDLLISYPTGDSARVESNHWHSVSSNVLCYTKLPAGMNKEQIEAQGEAFLKKHIEEEDDSWDQSIVLMSLREVHFFTEGDHFGAQPASRESLWTLGVIGIFLLLTACINFVNLNTVLIFRRAREVGLRKVLGSLRGQIVGYFLTETGILTLVALLLALALAPFVTRELGPLLGGNWTFTGTASGGGFWLYVLLVFLGVVLAAGLYPAFLLARIQPVQSLKNRIDLRYGQGINLRKSLVVLQFAISQALLIVTLIMMSQMDYFRTRPLGFNREAVLQVNLPREALASRNLAFKEQLLTHPDIGRVSLSNSGTTSGSIWKSNYTFFPSDTSQKVVEDYAQIKVVDPDYLATYGIQLLAGEDLIPTDSANRCLINTSLLKFLGIQKPEEALGLMIESWGQKMPISGVVGDFHTTSLHQPIEPVLIWVSPDNYYMAAIKLKRIAPEVLDFVQQQWEASYPGSVYQSRFLDESIERFYAEEDRAYKLFRLFAGLAIVIGCLGLFGLISFMAASRSKEVGIRKVLGASVGQLVGLFTKEFAWLVLIGFGIAAPAAWYLTQAWLSEFAYRIEPGAGFFLAGLLLSGLLVVLTVGYKAYRTATTNPVEALRDE